MAKSSKKSFKESVADYAALSERIGRRQFAPVYLLMGEEPYFIDMLAERLGETILSPEERAFDQTVVYGRDTEAGAIVNFCRQMPMMGAFQVVIVREAQTLRRIDQLSLYTSAPSPTTILVLCHKEKGLDKRSQLYKQIEAKGAVFESVAPRDYEIAGWLGDFVRSKDFNNFELTRAMSERNVARAMLIADHFARNPKENPLLVTVSALFTHFQRIFILNYQKWYCRRKGAPMPPDAELARMLKLPTAFFLKEYQQAAALYPNNKVFAILGLLREYDLKSKGMNTGQADGGELLKELLLKIFLL